MIDIFKQEIIITNILNHINQYVYFINTISTNKIIYAHAKQHLIFWNLLKRYNKIYVGNPDINFIFKKYDVLVILCEIGDLSTIQKLHDNYKTDDMYYITNAFRHCVEYGHLHVLIWLHAKYCITIDTICNCMLIYIAMEYKHLHILQWLHDFLEKKYLTDGLTKYEIKQKILIIIKLNICRIERSKIHEYIHIIKWSRSTFILRSHDYIKPCQGVFTLMI